MKKVGELQSWEEGINEVVVGDCMELMRKMPDKCIDLVLTDPPYNAKREYANDNLEEEEYTIFTNNYLSECKRLLKDDANLVVIIGVKYQKPIIEWLFKNLNYCWEFVWWKSNGMLNGKATFSKFEKVLWFSTGGGKHNRLKEVATDVWNIPIEVQANNFGHPTPKNIKGIKKIIQLLSNKDDLIFDPFMGSWTAGRACKDLGRNFIGAELSEEYCKIGENRLRQNVLL